jgi:hypothetical protein
MVAFATASAAANNTASAECMYLLVMLCILWQSKEAGVRPSEIASRLGIGRAG